MAMNDQDEEYGYDPFEEGWIYCDDDGSCPFCFADTEYREILGTDDAVECCPNCGWEGAIQ
jgi:hypothetical protein